MRRFLPCCLSLLLVPTLAAEDAPAPHVDAAAAAALAKSSDDKLESDEWYVGTINGQPALSMHNVALRHADGHRSTTTDMAVVIKRELPGLPTSVMSVHDLAIFDEDADGRISAFRFDHDEGTGISSAVGTITAAPPGTYANATAAAAADPAKLIGEIVHATLHRSDRSSEITIDVPAATPLVGDRRGQELITAHAHKQQDQIQFASLGLLSDRIVVANTTATFLGKTNGQLVFDAISDVMPLPMRLNLTPAGDLISMKMNLAVVTIQVTRAAGPVALGGGAEISPEGAVQATGPVPGAGPRNRYRLPAGTSVIEDEFQSRDGDVLTVRSTAQPSVLDEATRAHYLQAEPHLETDDAGLRAWTLGIARIHAGDPAAQAEDLRMAVRAYITKKDLNVADGSALDTFKSREGDCTEHASMLCACLRIANIPARIDIGLVYSADHGGWVGHAWDSGYIDGHWTLLDAAYPGVDRSWYLKLASGSGDEGIGTALLKNLGSMAGKTVETLGD